MPESRKLGANAVAFSTRFSFYPFCHVDAHENFDLSFFLEGTVSFTFAGDRHCHDAASLVAFKTKSAKVSESRR